MSGPIVPSARPGVIFVTRNVNDPFRPGTLCSPVLPPDPGDPFGKGCLDCGRITTRHDENGRFFCLAPLPSFPRCAVCLEALKPIRAGQTVHPGCDPASKRLMAVVRGLIEAGLPYCTCPDVQNPGNCAHCREFRRRAKTR